MHLKVQTTSQKHLPENNSKTTTQNYAFWLHSYIQKGSYFGAWGYFHVISGLGPPPAAPRAPGPTKALQKSSTSSPAHTQILKNAPPGTPRTSEPTNSQRIMLRKINDAQNWDEGPSCRGGLSEANRIFPEHPGPILHAPRDNISRKDNLSLRYN